MKNYNRYGLIPALAAAALALGSCNESIRTYDGQTGIYFAMLQSGSDEENPRYTADSSLPFALLPSGTDEQTLQLRVKVIGSVADYPRAFAFRTVADRTTAQEGHDYELPEGDCVVAAGEVYGYIPIRFFRRASLDGKELTLTLELLPNEQFDLPLSAWLPVNGTETVGTDVLRHTVTVSDKYVRLDGWSDQFYGPYSDKKIKLMCSVFDLTLADFQPDALSYVERKVLGQNFRRYLDGEERAGRTVYEDYLDGEGNPVKMESGPDSAE